MKELILLCSNLHIEAFALYIISTFRQDAHQSSFQSPTKSLHDRIDSKMQPLSFFLYSTE